ncbi:hypothetical protein [Celeribacter sp.]|uniref:hypothetical protein n=1 Tax=Celeribacter sp. TaxID=1890673 RepID=UPI003A920450
MKIRWTYASKAAALAFAALGATMSAAPAHALTVDFTIDATATPGWSPTDGLDTGIYLPYGSEFSIAVDPDALWSFGGGLISTNADGDPLLTYSNNGLTAGTGTLVGRVGGSSYFSIGTSYSGTAQSDGNLFLFAWDGTPIDNSGELTVYVGDSLTVPNIPTTPLPATALMLAGALGLGALGTRRKRGAGTQSAAMA